MEKISDEQLLEVYSKAVELNLRLDFIEILRAEMIKRGLEGSQE